MNCKQGDLALVIAGDNAGRVLTCLRLIAADSKYSADAPIWRVDRNITWYHSYTGKKALFTICPDSILMPINPLGDIEEIETSEIKSEVRV